MSPSWKTGTESRLRARKRKKRTLIASCVFGAVVLLFLLSWFLANASFLRIETIDVGGTRTVPQESLRAVALHNTASGYLGLFSKRNIFLYPKKQIERDILGLYPTIKTVSVQPQNFHTAVISVEERAPRALWCPPTSLGAQEGGTDSLQDCVLLDENGLAYANAPQYSGAVYQTYVGALPEGPLPQQFLEPELFRSLYALMEAFSKAVAPDTLERVSVDANGDVRAEFFGGYAVLFAARDTTGKIFERFSLARTAEPFAGKSLSAFEYIDLRFGDKVYYKLKNQ